MRKKYVVRFPTNFCKAPARQANNFRQCLTG